METLDAADKWLKVHAQIGFTEVGRLNPVIQFWWILTDGY